MPDPLAMMAALSGNGSTADAMCRRLVFEANRLGGRDNITVAIALPRH
jgi:hypothetical protein